MGGDVLAVGNKVISVGNKIISSGGGIGSLPGLMSWIDVTKEPVVANGTAQSGLQDWSGNGNFFNQVTAGDRPLYSTNVFGSAPSVLFDGTSDHMRGVGLNALRNATGFTVYIVLKRVSGGGFQFHHSNGTTGGARLALATQTPDFSYRILDADASTSYNINPFFGNTNVSYVYTFSLNFTTGRIFVYRNSVLIRTDIVSVSAATSSNTNSTGIGLGAVWNGATASAFSNVHIGALIQCNKAHDESTILYTQGVLRNQFSI
jgi:hypothetical protein